jgi:NADH:ubiquinone oxidoreductase subunit F (NADH-binding)/(2Fe-2S) ferredoxin
MKPLEKIGDMRQAAIQRLTEGKFQKRLRITVGSATCENAAGANEVFEKFRALLGASGKTDIDLSRVGCTGKCGSEPIVTVYTGQEMPVKYVSVTAQTAEEIFQTHILGGRVAEQFRLPSTDQGRPAPLWADGPVTNRFLPVFGDAAYFSHQTRMALRNCGVIDPESLDEYLAVRGYEALAKVLQGDSPQGVVDEMKKSGLRGRGGGGFSTGIKWGLALQVKADQKYMICNADEGDPGAFMDRSNIEGDPHTVLEGLLIAGYAIGASKGYFYIRAEYPLAVERLEIAIEAARKAGLLGKMILGSDFSFDVEIRLGAGAFVCGEETALMHSIEGVRGMPRPRPPYPATRGLWGKPTVINNVETLANVPVVILDGGDFMASIGTAKSKGTKVFALAGDIENTGLLEIPMGTTLRDVVYGVGGGIKGGKKLKAVQTGGPAGGCLPESMLDTPIDYDTLMAAGSIMGSGGMIVMDEGSCMVNVARFFLEFTQDESCGKCTPCREGTKRMLEILTRLTEGQGVEGDVDKLLRLAEVVKKTSLCGLGQACPNPVISTIKHFRAEYDAHIREKKCPAGACAKLLNYSIDAELCVGCGACRKVCPVACISGETKKRHVIDANRCIKCGSCVDICKFHAVKRG